MMIGVIGGSECSPEIAKIAYEVGMNIAERGATLVCGGLGGVMEAACEGAKRAGGTTVGILPGMDKAEANPFVDIPIVTGMSEARNNIVVRSADALIAITGSYGTLSEIAIALNIGKPVVSLRPNKFLNAQKIDKNLYFTAHSPEHAVELALHILTNK